MWSCIYNGISANNDVYSDGDGSLFAIDLWYLSYKVQQPEVVGAPNITFIKGTDDKDYRKFSFDRLVVIVKTVRNYFKARLGSGLCHLNSFYSLAKT